MDDKKREQVCRRYDDYGDDDDGVDIVRDYLCVTNMSFKLYII